jgi:toxin FitB
VAEAWGTTLSRSEAAGRPIGAMDAFLAATAEICRLTLVTRNVSDFPLLKTVLNPWNLDHEWRFSQQCLSNTSSRVFMS